MMPSEAIMTAATISNQSMSAARFDVFRESLPNILLGLFDTIVECGAC